MRRFPCRFYCRWVCLVMALYVLGGCPPPSIDNIAAELLADFDALDTNDNGLSFAEARSGVGTLTRSQFDQIDTDGNGFLSSVELGGPDNGGEGEGEGEGEWPGAPNLYSWDGSWDPEPGELPPIGLFDDLYFDGHEVNGEPSPVLPPGAWDFVDPNTMQVSVLASFDNFSSRVGTINMLEDGSGEQFGWRIDSVVPNAMELDFRANPYDGSSGTDVVDVGSAGFIKFSDLFGTGDGPDMVRYVNGSASDWRTGSDLTGEENDNDLVIGGSEDQLASDESDVRTSTVHTGPGRDLVFMNNMERAAIDLGNGANGRTDTRDPGDGGDMAIIGRNFLDCRVFGGAGDDVFVWYIDEANPNVSLLKNSFFGGGGWTPAEWEDTGNDRLVLVVPTDTVVTDDIDEISPGMLQVRIPANYDDEPVPDLPTEDDVFTRYFGTAGVSPDGRRTMIFRYLSASGQVRSGFIFMTAIEEFQVGVGAGARVYRLDDKAGQAVLAEDLEPLATLPERSEFHAIMDDFVNR